LTGLYEYIQAENKALKLRLASLQCLGNDILTEIKKPIPTAQQPEIQVPETASAPTSQQSKEKQKRMTLGELSPTPQPPTKAVQAVSPNPPIPPNPRPPIPTTPPPCNEDTEMQLVLASSETNPAMIASDGFSDLIGKRALWRRCRSLEKKEWVEDKVEATATGTGGRHGTASARARRRAERLSRRGTLHLHLTGALDQGAGGTRSGLPGQRWLQLEV
jgi:hypothetical protein